MGTIRVVGVLSVSISISAFFLLLGCASQAEPESQERRSQASGTAHARLVSFGRPVASLGVLSVNLWHKDRPAELRAVADELRADPNKDPDFIMCQEVVFGRSGTARNTAEVLARQLGYHARGTKRTSDREGIAIVSRYPFAWYGERHLKSQTSRLLLGFKRVSVMGEFMVPGAGRVRVVNVHFTNWGFEKHIRVKQLRETLDWIAERERSVPAAMTFLGGDFNAEPDSDEIELVMNFKGPRGMRWRSFNDPDDPSKGSPGRPSKRIDYIFVADAASAPSLAFAGEQLLWKNGVPRGRHGNGKFHLSDHLAVLHRYAIDRPDIAVTRVE
jgi:endonuclease/exonuclease/phosphatase family metal-dependent hydrolase